jgi:cholesterol transport system auxiliary component
MKDGRGRAGRAARALAAWLGAAALAACTFGGAGDPVQHTYLLGGDGPARAAAPPADPRAAATLLVGQPQALAGFDTPRMAYVARPHEVSYYAASQWADVPGRMVAPLLARALERTGAWRAVVQGAGAVRADYRVDADSLTVAHELFEKPSRVRLALRLQLVETRERRVLGTRAFEVVEAAPGDDAYGAALAANRALPKLLEQAAEWASGCMKDAAKGC